MARQTELTDPIRFKNRAFKLSLLSNSQTKNSQRQTLSRHRQNEEGKHSVVYMCIFFKACRAILRYLDDIMRAI